MEGEHEKASIEEPSEREEFQVCETLYDFKKSAINDSIEKLKEFTDSLKTICEKSDQFVNSLQLLEKIVTPDVIGSSFVMKFPHKHIFDKTGYLMEALKTFTEIFTAYSDRIKTETIDEFDNFIMQVVSPSREELRGVHDHNKNIIEEYRNGFYSLMNHFYVLGAELLEKFLICGECNVPIGFTHQLGCSIRKESDRNFKWKKTTFDDKFITFDMRFSFSELLNPRRRREIVRLIGQTASKQIQIGNRERISLPLVGSSSWPSRWNRGSARSGRDRPGHRSRVAYPVHIVHPPIFNPSAWTPAPTEMQNYVSFTYREESAAAAAAAF